MATAQPSPGRDLMNRIRTGFILQNTTFTAWCRHEGLHMTAARQAIYGTWNGPKARSLRARIIRAARISA